MERYTLVLRAQRAILLALAACAVFAVWSAWDELPTRLASHFDAGGRPDGYMSREAFFATMAAVGCAVVLPLAFLSALLRVVPNAAINVPHRDYWLTAERREQSIQRIGAFGGWFSIATAALLLMVVALTLRANVDRTGLDMQIFGIGFGLYLASMVLLLVTMYRQFARAPSLPGP